MSDTGISTASLNTIVKPASRELLTSNNAPNGFTLTSVKDGILGLTKFETKCLLIQLGNLESNSNSSMSSISPTRLGKYQTSQWLLKTAGYLDTTGSWTNKNGVDTDEIFLSANSIQESIVRDFIQTQYVELIKAGAIRAGDSKSVIGGMLALAYQYQDLGDPQSNQSIYNTNGTLNLETYSIATKANVWRNNGQTLDSQGRPGHIYFNGGKYAISNLGADIQE